MKNKLSAVIIAIFFAAAIFSGCSSEKGGEISVKLSIETEEKVLYSEELKANENDTPFEILKKYCDDNEIKYEYNDYSGSYYVSAIDGYKEGNDGQFSGWVYYVNGEFPQESSGTFVLREGDEIVFRYVTEFVME